MQTRAAARKAADASATGGSTSHGATTLATGGEPAPRKQAVAVPKRTAAARKRAPAASKLPTATSDKASAVPKRNRGKAALRQPMKGGWVLPHGMGASISPAEAPVPDDEIGPTPNVEDGTSVLKTSPQITNQEEPAENGAKTQRKITFRVTKPANSVEVEESATKETGEHPVESTRLTRSSTVNRTSNEAVHKSDLLVKEEDPTVIVDVAAKISTRKLLLIKGIVIAGGISAKSGGKVVVDATQILDPNFRMMLKRGLDNPYGLTPGFSPYPYRQVPTPEDCEEVYRLLADMHGECKPPEIMPAASLKIAGCGEVPCVLDALLRTLISGYTKMEHADKAISNLVEHYGLRNTGTGKGSINWEKVRDSPHEELQNMIRIAGGAVQRSRYIKLILDAVYEENLAKYGPDSGADLLSLDHMHSMTKDEALAKFVSYPGIGVKTAACVTLFCLQIPCFAVDTHVQKFCRWLGWTPSNADPDNCFRHGDHMVPDHLKYGLHQLFIRHGQLCFKCRKATKPGTKDWKEAPDCPLEHLLARTKDESVSGKRRRNLDDEGSDPDDEDDDQVENPRKKKKKTSSRPEMNRLDVNGEDGDKEEAEVEVKSKRPRTRKRAKGVNPPVKDDSDTDIEADTGEEESKVDIKTKLTRKARLKATKAQAKATPTDEDGVVAKVKRITRANAIRVAIKQPSDISTDSDADEEVGDELQQAEMDIDTGVNASERSNHSQGDTNISSGPSELRLQQSETEIDLKTSANEAIEDSQDGTETSSTLSEPPELSDDTELSELSDLSEVSDAEDR